MIRFTQDEILNIINLYQNKISTVKIGKIYNVSYLTIIRILRKNSIKIRSIREASQKYKIQENFFEKIDSHTKAQILGMIFADGNLHKAKNQDTWSLSIQLQEQDRYYVEKINEIIKNERRVYKAKRSQICNDGTYHINYRFSTNNYKICKDINKLGIDQRKSLTCDFPSIEQVPDEFLSSFILGYFEGDGCFYVSKFGVPHIYIAVSKLFGEKLVKIVKEKLGITSRLKIDLKYFKQGMQDICIRNFVINGGCQVTKFLDWIYSNNNKELILERKYQKYLEFRKKYDENNKFIKSDQYKQIQKIKCEKTRKTLNGKYRNFYILSPENQLYYSNIMESFCKKYNLSKRQISTVLNFNYNYKNWRKPTEIEIEKYKINVINEIFEDKRFSDKYKNFYIKHLTDNNIYFVKSITTFYKYFNDIKKQSLTLTIRRGQNKGKNSTVLWRTPIDQEIEQAKINNSIIILE